MGISFIFEVAASFQLTFLDFPVSAGEFAAFHHLERVGVLFFDVVALDSVGGDVVDFVVEFGDGYVLYVGHKFCE